MRIDVHAHYWTEDYLDLLVGLGKADAGEARGLGAGDGAERHARLRLMDRAGVEMQPLSAARQLPVGWIAKQLQGASARSNRSCSPGGGAQLRERGVLDLADSFRAHAEVAGDLAQRLLAATDPVTGADDGSLALGQPPEQVR